MKVVIDSIEISGTDRHGNIEAEIEFRDEEDVINEFGLKDCLSAFGKTDFLDEIGWTEAEEFFSEEIQERIDKAVEEALASKE